MSPTFKAAVFLLISIPTYAADSPAMWEATENAPADVVSLVKRANIYRMATIKTLKAPLDTAEEELKSIKASRVVSGGKPYIDPNKTRANLPPVKVPNAFASEKAKTQALKKAIDEFEKCESAYKQALNLGPFHSPEFDGLSVGKVGSFLADPKVIIIRNKKSLVAQVSIYSISESGNVSILMPEVVIEMPTDDIVDGATIKQAEAYKVIGTAKILGSTIFVVSPFNFSKYIKP